MRKVWSSPRQNSVEGKVFRAGGKGACPSIFPGTFGGKRKERGNRGNTNAPKFRQKNEGREGVFARDKRA